MTMTATTTTTKSTGSAASAAADGAAMNALHILQSPDGYYKYLNVPKPKPSPSTTPGAATEHQVDMDLIRRNYRRLSLRHHPDRRGGDADTFRVLNRAKRVLTTGKLRKQYDLLGLDLEEEEEGEEGGGEEEEEGGGTETAKHADNGDSDNGNHHNDDNDKSAKKKEKTKRNGEGGDASNNSNNNTGGDTVIGRLASAALASILQFTARTGMMGLASTLLCRFRWTLIPSILVLAFVSIRIFRSLGVLMEDEKGMAKSPSLGTRLREASSPLWIASGLSLMHIGRNVAADEMWSWKFWMGEALVMSTFGWNSIAVTHPGIHARPTLAVLGIGLGSGLACLLLRGKWARYVLVVVLQLGLAVALLIVFPVMELVVEEIIQEKLRKVGDKVRAHSQRMEQAYQAQLAAAKRGEGEGEGAAGNSRTRTGEGSSSLSSKMNAMD